MAVILKFNVCQSDCSKLIFTETTGIYNEITNPNGWGAPNELTSDATAATLTVVLASGSSYIIDLFTEGFPTDDSSFEFLIPNDSIGYIVDSPITDQVINFTYSVTTATTTYTQNIQVALYCQVGCCVQSMLKNIDVDCDSCSKSQRERYTQVYLLYKGLIYNANSGNVTAFNNILTQVNKLCVNTNCQNCK